VLISPNRQAVPMREPFPRRRLAQAAAVAGVVDVRPLYFENGFGHMRGTHPDSTKRNPTRPVRIIGVDPDAFQLTIPELDPADPRYLGDKLKTPGSALFDRNTRAGDAPGEAAFGPLRVGGTTEIAGRNVTFVGSVALGPDFTTDGVVVLSAETFHDLLRYRYGALDPESEVDLGLVRLEPGADPQRVKALIREAVAHGAVEPDVEVYTPDELVAREHRFWLGNTPIGFAFGFGMFMGFAVGMVICYQILSSDVGDHLPEYATLKAMGYTNRYLAWVVIQEALILAVAGFAIGLVISWLSYLGLADATGMPLRMSSVRIVTVFVATVGMCVLSGLIALVRLMRADPADVFA
jgi:putative ABC transport system permease protein